MTATGTYPVILNLTADDLDDLIDELDQAAERHQRAAMAAALELDADETTKDKRTGALAITRTLTRAGRLTRHAGLLRGYLQAIKAGKLDALDLDPAGPARIPQTEPEPAVEVPDQPPATAPTRAETLAEIEAEVAAINGADPDTGHDDGTPDAADLDVVGTILGAGDD